MNKQKTHRLLSILLSVAALLTISLPAAAQEEGTKLKPKGAASTSGSATRTTAVRTSGGNIAVSSLKAIATEYNVPDDFLDAISGQKSISKQALRTYAAEYSLPAQYVQRFFDDYFVFKAGNGLQYIAVNSKYPKNNYNFDNLVTYSSGEKKYVVNGQSKALKGIDVSEFQGDINWKQVKSDGVKFAIIRVGYRGYGTGTMNLDAKFHQNMKGAAAAGIPVGVYFFSQAVSTKEAIEEANFTLDELKGYDLEYPVVIDLEAGGSGARTANLSAKSRTAIASAFCQTVKKAGYRPMIYSNSQWFLKEMNMQQLPYDRWLALYYQHPFFPYKMNIWQYTGEGRVKGIKGNVDLNLCFVKYT